MSEQLPQDSFLTRRHWLVLAASAVSGCGGGSASTTAGLSPGTGGTGVIYSQGSISGFGSVIVNNIEFDDRAAIVQLDGTTLSSADLRLGMVASVQGERGADPKLGTASHIAVWSIAQGLVTNVAQGVATEFTVAGIKVQADANTVFDGLANASAVATGQRVAVWGLQAGADDSRRWHATRVEVVADTALVSTGLVTAMGSQSGLNGLILTGPAAGNLTMGQLVRVRGALSAAGTSLQIERVDVQGSALAMQSKGEVEIEGFVTDTPTASGFMLGNIVVDASAIAPISTQIKKGARVEVHGTWQSGVLKATEVELEAEQTLQTVELKGVMDPFVSKAEFWVRGQRCDATGITKVDHGTLADLKQGVEVKLKGSKAGDVVVVTELEIVVDD